MKKKGIFMMPDDDSLNSALYHFESVMELEGEPWPTDAGAVLQFDGLENYGCIPVSFEKEGRTWRLAGVDIAGPEIFADYVLEG